MLKHKKWLTILVLMILLGGIFGSGSAQSYSFSLDQAVVDLYINADGSATIEYTLDFNNDPGAHAIDYVDIGLPNDSYDIGSITASINGKAITHIANSQYVDHGVELGLGSNAIPSGASGRVKARIGLVHDMIYESDLNEADMGEAYASFEFSPNWFGSEYCHGNTDYTITVYLPPGIESDEPRYHTPQKWPGADEPQSGYDEQGSVFYSWYSPDANGYTQYIFGASFPARTVPTSTIQTQPSFDFSIIGAFIENLFENSCPIVFACLFFAFPVLSGIWGSRQNKKRKLKYLPPKVTIEGHGIKRGLTAVEAAVLMEMPVDKILSMVLFSAVKKEAAIVTSRDPLKLKVTKPLPEDLHSYEKLFVEAFQQSNVKTQRRQLQKMTVDMINSVTKKMKGFSHKETVAYYEDIMQRAWKQVEDEGTPEVQMKKFDEAIEWTMLDDDFGRRTQTTFGPRPVFLPMWWGRYDPTFRPSASSARPTVSGSGGGQGGSFSLPTLPGSAFAASVVGGMQDFSSNVVGDLTAFTSGITQTTNPIPKAKSSGRSGGRSGGGGCACACACAGCACACAGGGR
jgi:hypothetical protein